MYAKCVPVLQDDSIICIVLHTNIISHVQRTKLALSKIALDTVLNHTQSVWHFIITASHSSNVNVISIISSQLTSSCDQFCTFEYYKKSAQLTTVGHRLLICSKAHEWLSITDYLWISTSHSCRDKAPWKLKSCNLQQPHPDLNSLIKGTPYKFHFQTYHANRWYIQLLCSENHVILFAVVLSQYTRVTDDRQIDNRQIDNRL